MNRDKQRRLALADDLVEVAAALTNIAKQLEAIAARLSYRAQQEHQRARKQMFYDFGEMTDEE